MYAPSVLQLLLALASLVMAQSSVPGAPGISDIPQCALLCFVQIVPLVGCSNVLDFGCSCAKFDKLQPAITPCVMKNCPQITDQLKTLRAAAGICAAQAGLRGAAITSAELALQTQVIVAQATGTDNSLLPTGTNGIATGLAPTPSPTTFVPPNEAPAPTRGAMMGAALGGLVGLAAWAL